MQDVFRPGGCHNHAVSRKKLDRGAIQKPEPDSGVDVERLKRNLALSPEQKLAQHERAAWFVLELIRARKTA